MMLVITILVLLIMVAGINIYVLASTKDKILTVEEASQLENVDCIIILGASVSGNEPSPMLKERIDKGVELYYAGCSEKILMSGDHCGEYYNEVKVMKDVAVSQGVSSSNIFLDHYGLSTYDSMYRAKNAFHAKKVVIVTQSYHLPRALFIAKALGLDAYGVATDKVSHKGQFKRNVREVLARVKDVAKSKLEVKPEYTDGDMYFDIDGNLTNER